MARLGYTMTMLFVATVAMFAVGMSLTPTSPTILWSNKDMVTGKGKEISELINAKDVEKFVDGNLQPELYMIFIEPKLETTQFYTLLNEQSMENEAPSFKNLIQLIEKSASSVVLPYTTSENNKLASNIVTKTYNELMEKSADTTVIVAANSDTSLLKSKTNVRRTSIEDLLQSATSDWKLLSNGVTDLIIVHMDEANTKADFRDHDTTVNTLVSSVKGASYVAIYASERSSFENDVMTDFADSVHEFEGRDSQEFLEDSDSTLWPDEAVEGLIVSIPFLIILSIGICCTFGVQSDLKFDGEKQKKFL